MTVEDAVQIPVVIIQSRDHRDATLIMHGDTHLFVYSIRNVETGQSFTFTVAEEDALKLAEVMMFGSRGK